MTMTEMSLLLKMQANLNEVIKSEDTHEEYKRLMEAAFLMCDGF